MPRSIESSSDDPTTTMSDPTSTIAPRIAVRTGLAVRFRKAMRRRTRSASRRADI